MNLPIIILQFGIVIFITVLLCLCTNTFLVIAIAQLLSANLSFSFPWAL